MLIISSFCASFASIYFFSFINDKGTRLKIAIWMVTLHYICILNRNTLFLSHVPILNPFPLEGNQMRRRIFFGFVRLQANLTCKKQLRITMADNIISVWLLNSHTASSFFQFHSTSLSSALSLSLFATPNPTAARVEPAKIKGVGRRVANVKTRWNMSLKFQ